LNSSAPLSKRRILLFAVLMAVIVALFAWQVDMRAAWAVLRTARPLPVLLGSLCLVGGLAVFAQRWRALLKNKPDLLFTFHAANIGNAANILLPFRAGEGLRVLVMGTDANVSLAESTSSFVIERLFEQLLRVIAIVGAIVLGVGLEPSPGTIGSGLFGAAVGFGIILWLARRPEFIFKYGTALLAKLPHMNEQRAEQSITDFLEVLDAISAPRRFFTVLLWSLVSWVFYWAFFYFTFVALDTGLVSEMQLTISLAALAISPPSASTQPGIFHASVVAPLAAVGFASEMLTAYAILLHIIELVLITSLAAWGLWATKVTFSDIRDLFRPDAMPTQST
jgi:uncharacterized protein (TIRG00374 family)